MPGSWDAEIELLRLAETGTRFTAAVIGNGKPFDVLANVEIGRDLMGVVSKHELFLTLLNLSDDSKLVLPVKFSDPLTPARNNTPLNTEIRLTINNWKANEGDILKAIATYKVTAGVHTNVSTAESSHAVVTD
ncbi:hypothetical protein GCM10010112_49350 [Actinoplanes lobatus]|uniref:Uncharacterized protein n=1 Tax=Actinoplanes lobatus TaxID=113568 RepID=A0A7W7HPB8_9ACTN|nr:hypothetical protein [Actinoplanes lobatus]MBB4754094.1 hypothetical protein [Actinoplanes lobatus]GGN76860.1 hypothetical protein GCM10010112_49350 [Actinoplanes lobatus]GIE40850.1 hypothetical protein Alo02nite_37480 [Actinoplanes lobatus]